TARLGTVLWSLLSWRLKSVTDELGRFSIRDRNSGGIRTAAHAAATTSSTSSPMRSDFLYSATEFVAWPPDRSDVCARNDDIECILPPAPSQRFHYDSTTIVTRLATTVANPQTRAFTCGSPPTARHSGRRYVPERPPVFSQRANSPIVMPRSADL